MQANDAVDHSAPANGSTSTYFGWQSKGQFLCTYRIADVTPQMRMTCEETFGSVIAVTAFETDDEVIERANSTQYGLAAYLYTRDLSNAILPSSKPVSESRRAR